MDVTQRNYIKNRIKEVVMDKAAALRVALTKPGKPLSGKRLLHLIRCGEVELKRDATLDTLLKNAYDFSEIPPDTEFDEKKYNAEVYKLEKQGNRIMDMAMLGDPQKAMELLEKFEEE